MTLSSALDRLMELDERESAERRRRIALMSLAETVIESLPDGLVVIDQDGKIILFNRKAELLFGYHRSDVIGKTMEMLLPERSRARHVLDRQLYSRFDINKRAQTMGVGMGLVALRGDGHEFEADITLARMVTHQGILSLALVRGSPRAADPDSNTKPTRKTPEPGSDRVELDAE